jgi:hypothetical protein
MTRALLRKICLPVRRRPTDASPRTACELTGRDRRPTDDRRDFLERQREHVVEDECESLCRAQRLEHDEQGEADGVGQQRLVLGIVSVLERNDRLGKPGADVVLAPRLSSAQFVETETRNDRGEPAAHVLDGVGVGAVQPQPRLLNDVVCVAHRAEHAIGDRPQVSPVSLELLRLPVALSHGHIRSSGSVT